MQMARLNRPIRTVSETVEGPVTHEGAPAIANLTPEQILRRSVLSCMLWEDEFYEDGVAIANRIVENAAKIPPDKLAALALEARTQFKLRHAPLVLLAVLAKTGAGSRLVGDAIAATIQRADELAEFLAVYASLNGQTVKTLKLSAQVKKGLARAFHKFDAHQIAKYDREGGVRLRDVMRLVRPKPGEEKTELWHGLIKQTLKSPDTWEVALSGGADKRETFERLLREGKLGYMALLRNLRNMEQAGVDPALVRHAILARKGAQRVLPFRYVAAARHAPQFEPFLDEALSEAVGDLPMLGGQTIVLVDVSGSMSDKLSGKSDLTRMDAAATLASIIHGDVRVFTFSYSTVEVPPRHGMAGVEAIVNSQSHAGTDLGGAVAHVNALPHDRLIVITDEQTSTRVPRPKAKLAYSINVASAQHGVTYGQPWMHLDGFSETVLGFISEYELRDSRTA